MCGPVEDTAWEGLVELSQEIRDLCLGTHVNVVHASDLDPLSFYREYVARNKPVILEGAIDHWPALDLWDDEYLSEIMGESLVNINLTPDGLGDAVKTVEGTSMFVMPEETQSTYSSFLKLMHDSKIDPTLGVPYCSHQNGNLLSEFRSVLKDVQESLSWSDVAFGSKPDAANFWAGDERSVTTYHQDHYENIYAVVRGEKIFTILPPEDVCRMYIRDLPCGRYMRDNQGKFHVERLQEPSTVPWSLVDPYPDESKRKDAERSYPGYHRGGPPPMVVHVHQGQVLYLPEGYFHHVNQKTSNCDTCCMAINYWYDVRHDARHAYRRWIRTRSRTDTRIRT